MFLSTRRPTWPASDAAGAARNPVCFSAFVSMPLAVPIYTPASGALEAQRWAALTPTHRP
jgi:hypothetical protein